MKEFLSTFWSGLCISLLIILLVGTLVPSRAQTLVFSNANCRLRAESIPMQMENFNCSNWKRPSTCNSFNNCPLPGFRILWEYGDGNYNIYDETLDCPTINPSIFPTDAFSDNREYNIYPNSLTFNAHAEFARIYTRSTNPIARFAAAGSSNPSSSCVNTSSSVNRLAGPGTTPSALDQNLAQKNVNLQLPNQLVAGSQATLILNYGNLVRLSDPDSVAACPIFSGYIDVQYNWRVLRIQHSDVRVYANESVDLTQRGRVRINFYSLDPGAYRNAFLTFQDRTGRPGYRLDFSAQMVCATADTNCTDTITLTPPVDDLTGRTIAEANDPNYKSVTPRYQTCDDEIKQLTYVIHFENDGNAATNHIVVRDTIDPRLNIQTLDVQRITIGGVEYAQADNFYVSPNHDFVEWTFLQKELKGLRQPLPGGNQGFFNPNFNETIGEIEYTIYTRCSLEFEDTLNRQAVIYFLDCGDPPCCGLPTFSQTDYFHTKQCLSYSVDSCAYLSDLAQYVSFPIAVDSMGTIIQDGVGVHVLDTAEVFLVGAPSNPLDQKICFSPIVSVPKTVPVEITRTDVTGLLIDVDTLCITFYDPAVGSDDCARSLEQACQTREMNLQQTLRQSNGNFSNATCLLTSIERSLESSTPLLMAFPNPVEEELSIDYRAMPRQDWDDLLLYDGQGRLLRRLSPDPTGQTRLQMYALPAGVYLMRMGEASVKLLRR